jgi:hypothetical protein
LYLVAAGPIVLRVSPTVGDSWPPDHGDGADVTMAELARRLDMAVTTVARWARCGRIPSSRTINGEIQFRPEDVAAVSVTPEA